MKLDSLKPTLIIRSRRNILVHRTYTIRKHLAIGLTKMDRRIRLMYLTRSLVAPLLNVIRSIPNMVRVSLVRVDLRRLIPKIPLDKVWYRQVPRTSLRIVKVPLSLKYLVVPASWRHCRCPRIFIAIVIKKSRIQDLFR